MHHDNTKTCMSLTTRLSMTTICHNSDVGNTKLCPNLFTISETEAVVLIEHLLFRACLHNGMRTKKGPRFSTLIVQINVRVRPIIVTYELRISANVYPPLISILT